MTRYFINVIGQLISQNRIKLSLILVAIICFNFAGSFENGTQKIPILTEFKDEATWVYIIRDKNDESGYEIFTSETKQKLVDNSLVVDDYSDLNILFWILFALPTLIVVISTIIGWVTDDNDVGWGLDNCQERSINNLIYCELEGDTFYYMALGRLIGQSKTQLKSRRITDSFHIYSLSDIKKCPKFSTKTQNRNNLLDKLGI